jgi:hypothetical protein
MKFITSLAEQQWIVAELKWFNALAAEKIKSIEETPTAH